MQQNAAICGWILLLSCIGHVSGAEESEEQMLVRGIREAMGIESWAAGQEWLWAGLQEQHGISSTFQLRFDSSGRFAFESEGELPSVVRFNGHEGWKTEWSSPRVRLEMATLEQEQIEAWILTGAWLADPSLLELEGMAANITAGGESIQTPNLSPNAEVHGEQTLTLRPSHGITTAELVIHAYTHLPLRIICQSLAGDVTYQLEDYEETAGVLFPRRVTRSVAGFTERELRVESVERVDASGADPYAAPRELPDDFRFQSPSADVPIQRAPTGHVLVQPTINGKLADWFILDTGAGKSGLSTTSPFFESAEKLGSCIVTSIFGTVQTPVAHVESFALGPIEIDAPYLMTMDLSPLTPYFGSPVGGIVGFDLFSRSVVELDLAEDRLIVHDPSRFELGKSAWSPLRLQDNHPIVEAKFNGEIGWFRLDIGAAGGPHANVLIHVPASRAHNLDREDAETVQLGNELAALGTLESFEFAGKSFPNLDVVFARDEDGLFSDAHTVGNIGVEVLQSFRIVFDYARHRIALIEK